MKISLFEHPSGDRPLTALSLLLCGVFALALQDSLVKLMSVDTSFWQFQTLRSLGNLSFIVVLALATGGLGLIAARNWRPVYLRAGFLTICMFFFFSGAPYLSVAQMAAGLYTYPLFVSLLAGPVLGEAVGPWRIAALILGAVGAACVLSPWQSDFSAVQILPIVAGFFYATNILTLRRACRNESPLALAFAVAVLVVYAYTLKPLGFLLPTALVAAVLSYQIAPRARFAALTGVSLSIGLFLIFRFALGLGLVAFPRWLTGAG